MKGSRIPNISYFYCLKCKNENTPIIRIKMRAKYHIKSMYCINCKEKTRNIELRNIDYKEDILLMMETLHDKYYSEKDYLFIRSNEQWWYKVDTSEKLFKYNQRLFNLKKHFRYKELSELINLNLVNTIISNNVYQSQINALEQFGILYFGKNGGFRINLDEEEQISQCELIYPMIQCQ